MMEDLFHRKVIVITGGASGIGKELVIKFAEKGAKVVIVDKNQKASAGLVRELLSLKYKVSADSVDMTNAAHVEALFERLIKTHKRIDYFINNAGIFMGGEIRDTKLDNWYRVMRNNIDATLNGTHYAYQQMLKQKSGHIINIASAAGLFPVPAMSIYGSTKFAIVGLTQALRNEAKDLGINVSVVCPGIVATPLYNTAIYNNLDEEKAVELFNKTQSAEKAAQHIIKGIERNKGTIHTTLSAKMAWGVYRLAPWAYNLFAQHSHRTFRRSLRK